MKASVVPQLGFSFSPGGLLLPYHLGVMDSLTQAGLLDETTPIAGSSAGAIAVACHACNLSSAAVLEATIGVSQECAGTASGGSSAASGRRLIPALRRQMQRLLGPQELETLQNRPGTVGIAYQELLPRPRAIVQTTFEGLDDLIAAVCFSSTFPFFSDAWPVALDTRQTMPRIVVDGFFSVPRDRMGCPDLNQLVGKVATDTTDDEDGENNASDSVIHEILVACFPQHKVRLTAVPPERCISPTENALDGAMPQQTKMRTTTTMSDNNRQPPVQRGMANFIQIAMEPSSASTYFKVYEQGLADGEAWSIMAASQLLLPPTCHNDESLN